MTLETPTARGAGPDEEVIAAFRVTLRGELIGPEDVAYDAARRVHNGMIDRYPRLIARCRDVADVIAAVDFGRDHELRDDRELLLGRHGAPCSNLAALDVGRRIE